MRSVRKASQAPREGTFLSSRIESEIKGAYLKKFLLPLFVLVCALQATMTLQAQSVPPPNIIIILADDLGYGDVSYNRVNPDFLTPNIDSLTINGVKCTNGYVTHPFCSPSRAALLTGRYQQRFGVENLWVNQPDNNNTGLPISELTLPQLLKPAGYICGLIGKWHLGTAPSLLPNQRGFDYFYGFLGGLFPYYNSPSYPYPLLQNGTPVSFSGYLTDVFTQRAVSFINNNAT